jgi:hypothetical protein
MFFVSERARVLFFLNAFKQIFSFLTVSVSFSRTIEKQMQLRKSSEQRLIEQKRKTPTRGDATGSITHSPNALFPKGMSSSFFGICQN